MPTTHPAFAAPNSMMLREHSAALRRHLQHCTDARGPWFAAAAFSERLHDLIAPRFVSTLVIAMLLLWMATEWI